MRGVWGVWGHMAKRGQDDDGKEEEQDPAPLPRWSGKNLKTGALRDSALPIKRSIGRALRNKSWRTTPPRPMTYASPAKSARPSL